jgi:hypothetical protein
MQISQGFALPPETGIGITLPEPAVFHFIEIPPLNVPVNKKNISTGRPGRIL